MNSPKTIEVIRQIQAYVKEENIKPAELIRRLRAEGCDVSPTGIRRLCTPGAELEDSFNYDLSVAPVANILFGQGGTAQTDALLSIIALRKEQLKAKEEELNQLRAQYDQRLAFLRDQIEKKDQYMQVKDEIILRFMDVLLPKKTEPEEAEKTE